jgi:CRP/FNR family transcriptional regulator, anaerobic regulatory protein
MRSEASPLRRPADVARADAPSVAPLPLHETAGPANDASACLGLAAEQRIHARGSVGQQAYTVGRGVVRFERVTSSGHRRIVRIAGPGELFGQEAWLQQAYRDEAVSCTAVTLKPIPLATLHGQPGNTPVLTLELMQQWQRSLDAAQDWAAEMMCGPARRRVLQLLNRLQDLADTPGSIWLPKREQMGDMLDIAVETASRVVASLCREGVVSLVPPQQALLDAARLRRALLDADR